MRTRSSAQGNCSAKSLAALVILSILPCSSILPGPPYPPPVMLSLGGGGGLARGVWPQGGSSHGGHFGPAAIYCITTWCFALKGLRTTTLEQTPLFNSQMQKSLTFLPTADPRHPRSVSDPCQLKQMDHA